MVRARFIVNSKLLRHVLKDMDLDILDKDETISVSYNGNGRVAIGSAFLFCDGTNAHFDERLTVKQLRRLQKIAGIMDEQPLTVSIDDLHWCGVNFVL